ncbi:methylated-DNA--[protein]-cysteine S-methyltransferase [Paracoccaceae bacterium]
MTVRAAFVTPLGRLVVGETAGVITSLHWSEEVASDDSPLLRQALAQLTAYFAGKLQAFDLPLDWGEGLNARVRRAMAAIPYGQTRTYGEISRDVGAPAQAVGQACGANPVPVFIPCHRVLGAAGLGGFSARGGVETKAALLRHEGALLL